MEVFKFLLLLIYILWKCPQAVFIVFRDRQGRFLKNDVDMAKLINFFISFPSPRSLVNRKLRLDSNKRLSKTGDVVHFYQYSPLISEYVSTQFQCCNRAPVLLSQRSHRPAPGRVPNRSPPAGGYWGSSCACSCIFPGRCTANWLWLPAHAPEWPWCGPATAGCPPPPAGAAAGSGWCRPPHTPH